MIVISMRAWIYKDREGGESFPYTNFSEVGDLHAKRSHMAAW
jgi:hypothetical protein